MRFAPKPVVLLPVTHVGEFFILFFIILISPFCCHCGARVKLENGIKYKISSVLPDLYLTSQEGLYNSYLGIVALEGFREAPQQRWEHTYLNEQDCNDTESALSVFLPEASWYNNVTSYHQKGHARVFNKFEATEQQDLFYTLKRVANEYEDDYNSSDCDECLQNMGNRQAVQMRSCEEGNEDQLWGFESV